MVYYSYDTLKNESSNLEVKRNELLRSKFALLKENNATCYNEIPNDLDKYKYRKYTEILRMINKIQQLEKNNVTQIISWFDKTFQQIEFYKTKIQNAK